MKADQTCFKKENKNKTKKKTQRESNLTLNAKQTQIFWVILFIYNTLTSVFLIYHFKQTDRNHFTKSHTFKNINNKNKQTNIIPFPFQLHFYQCSSGFGGSPLSVYNCLICSRYLSYYKTKHPHKTPLIKKKKQKQTVQKTKYKPFG